MRQRKKQSGVLAAVALALACGQPVLGVDAVFDPDGSGPGASISGVEQFVFNAGSLYSDGSVRAVDGFLGLLEPDVPAGTILDFKSYFQVSVGSIRTETGLVPVSNGEITMVGGFTQRVKPDTQLLAGSFGFVDDNQTEFVEIYYDSTPDVDATAGTGFNNGQLILRADILAFDHSTFVVPGDVNNLPNLPIVPLDSFNDDGNQYPNTVSVVGSGETTGIELLVTYADTQFFASGFGGSFEVSDAFFGSPFDETNPSNAFATVANPGLGDGPAPTVFDIDANLPIGVGPVNGATGQDIIFQVKPFLTFNVPEPSTAALLFGFGLAWVGRRSQR